MPLVTESKLTPASARMRGRGHPLAWDWPCMEQALAVTGAGVEQRLSRQSGQGAIGSTGLESALGLLPAGG
jgi:hypothetical protein